MRKLGHELFCNLQTFVLWRARDISREQNETPVGHKPILSFGRGASSQLQFLATERGFWRSISLLQSEHCISPECATLALHLAIAC